jgi:hypothetical protein
MSGRPTPPRYRVVTGRPGVLDHVEHLTPRGEPCGPIGPERTMNRAGEYAPGIVVCCAACGDGVPDVPPSVVAIVEAAERRWETEQTKGEERARALDRLIAAGVDVTQLPPPKAKRRGRRRQQALSFAAPPSGPYSVPGREGTPADVAAGERQARAIVELGGEEP